MSHSALHPLTQPVSSTPPAAWAGKSTSIVLEQEQGKPSTWSCPRSQGWVQMGDGRIYRFPLGKSWDISALHSTLDAPQLFPESKMCLGCEVRVSQRLNPPKCAWTCPVFCFSPFHRARGLGCSGARFMVAHLGMQLSHLTGHPGRTYLNFGCGPNPRETEHGVSSHPWGGTVCTALLYTGKTGV